MVEELFLLQDVENGNGVKISFPLAVHFNIATFDLCSFENTIY